MKTKILKITPLLLFILFVCSCYEDGFRPCVRGNNSTDTEHRTLADFHQIDYQMEGDVIVKKGVENKVVIEGNSNQISEVKTRVQNGKLKIYSERCLKNTDFSFTVYAVDLSEFKLAGSGDAFIQAGFDFEEMNVELAGSGEVEAVIESASRIKARISGSGNIQLQGSCDSFESQISGSGKIRAYPLVASSATVNISGSGILETFVTSSLTANISGSGEVRFKGNPPAVNSNISGSGKVVKVQ